METSEEHHCILLHVEDNRSLPDPGGPHPQIQWKLSQLCVQKRHRMIEKQNDLKEVIVHLRTPSGAQTGPRDLSGKAASSGPIPTTLPDSCDVPRTTEGEKGCESCLATTATRWYLWGPAHEHCRLCNLCYTYWRKYGGLKLPTRWGECCYPALTPSYLLSVPQRPVRRRLGS